MVIAEFIRDGQPLYYSTQIAGYIGILTGLKLVCKNWILTSSFW